MADRYYGPSGMPGKRYNHEFWGSPGVGELTTQDLNLARQLLDFTVQLKPKPVKEGSNDRTDRLVREMWPVYWDCIKWRNRVLRHPRATGQLKDYLERRFALFSPLQTSLSHDSFKYPFTRRLKLRKNFHHLYMGARALAESTRFIHTFMRLDEKRKARFIYPKLEQSEIWIEYGEDREMGDVAVFSEDWNLQRKGRAVLASAEGFLYDMYMEEARRLVSQFVRYIHVVPSDDEEMKNKVGVTYGDDYQHATLRDEIKQFMVDVLFHEAEHLRFKAVVRPLIESGLVMFRVKETTIPEAAFATDYAMDKVASIVGSLGSDSVSEGADGRFIDMVNEDLSLQRTALGILDEFFAIQRSMEMFLKRDEAGFPHEEDMTWMERDDTERLVFMAQALDYAVDIDPLIYKTMIAPVLRWGRENGLAK